MAPSTTRPRSKRPVKFTSVISNLDFNSLRKDIRTILTNPEHSWLIGLLLLLLEVIVTAVVIIKIPYTEIDWKAYMQEVEGVVNGTFDYKELKGDTGPLVYPAGFVYVYLLLYYITLKGTSILVAQCIFAFLYLATLYVVFRLYVRSNIVPPYALIFMCCTSYRIHSIFVLRLFNDPVAVFFLFCAINFFCDDKWITGSIFFSFAVSIKMNILLFAPGLFFVMLHSIGVYLTFHCIFICAVIQFLVGLPFLIANPVSYMTCAFDLGRVFLHQWTVNWRFVPEDIFVSRMFHISLLFLHLVILSLFAFMCIKNFGLGAAKAKCQEFDYLSIDSSPHTWKLYLIKQLLSQKIKISIPLLLTDSLRYPHIQMLHLYILFIMFTSNFIGIAFSRSLHYQFYVWYFFTLPHLLWSTNYNPVFKLCILGILELCWNTYPSTDLSSSMLHVCHLLIMCNLLHVGFKVARRKTA